MSRSKNTFKLSDISTTPVKLKYSSSFNKSNWSSVGISVYSGSNGLVNVSGSVNQSIINYRLIRQLYYQNYLTGSQLGSASYWDWNQQSTACQGSNEHELRYFPTESNKSIYFATIPRSLYGEQIARSSFLLSYVNTASLLTGSIYDDGNGNLIEKNAAHAGNIIYSQGIAIITDDKLKNYLTSSNVTMSFYAETTIYQNEYRCRVNENDFNYTLNPSANTNGLTGSYIDAITGSEFRPYATCVGLYNESDELLVVGKLATPYPIPQNTDITFVVRWDS